MSEEIREKIAKRLGYRWYEVGAHAYLVNASGKGMIDKKAVLVESSHPMSERHYRCPDWPTSIADAYALEAEIPEDERDTYADCLKRIIYDEDNTVNTLCWQLAHATAEQRCKAWLAWHDAQGGGGDVSA